MHALRRFIQDEMDQRGWRPRDLARASGLSKQVVSLLVNDDRDVLPQLPRTSTLDALGRAFGVSTGHVTAVAVQALGVPDVSAPPVVHELASASDEELLRELLARAEKRMESESQEPPPAPTVEEVEEKRQTMLAALAELDSRGENRRTG